MESETQAGARLKRLKTQLEEGKLDGNLKKTEKAPIHYQRGLIIENDENLNYKPKFEYFKKSGWGYKDTEFLVDGNDVYLSGMHIVIAFLPNSVFRKQIFILQKTDAVFQKMGRRRIQNEHFSLNPTPRDNSSIYLLFPL
jgi:hypothetical protein